VRVSLACALRLCSSPSSCTTAAVCSSPSNSHPSPAVQAAPPPELQAELAVQFAALGRRRPNLPSPGGPQHRAAHPPAIPVAVSPLERHHRRKAEPVAAALHRRFRPLPFVSNAGDHIYAIPSISSFRSEPQPSARPPPPPCDRNGQELDTAACCPS
jgi:hypothetical protein